MRFQRKHPVYKLFFGHLQAEDRHRLFPFKCHMLCQIQHKCRLTHGWPCRNQHQIRRLKPGSLIIQIHKPGLQAGYSSPCPGSSINLFHYIDDHLTNRNKLAPPASLRQVKDPLFCLRQRIAYLLGTRVAGIGDFLIQSDQAPCNRLFCYNLRIIFDIGRGKSLVHPAHEQLNTACLLRHSFFLQTCMQDHRFHRFPFIIKCNHGVIDHAHLLLVKIRPCDHFRGSHDLFIVYEHGADDGAFCFLIMGHNTFYECFIHLSPCSRITLPAR